LAERRKHLAKTIREFRSVQKVYMPGLSHLLDNADNDSRLDTHPELFKLMLPHQLSSNDRQSWCLPGLSTLEARFRYAQADDALAEIRRLRRLFQGLSDQNKKHINSTQHTITRAKSTFERYKARISRFASLYRCAHQALVALDPSGQITSWTGRLHELNDADIRGPGREENEPSEGRTVSSWIWSIHKIPQPLDGSRPDDDTNTSDPETSDLSQRAASGEEVAVSIRAHWARCQARAERYEEEVELTVEEMRRTLQFFKWKSQWWLMLQDIRASSATPPDPQVAHGLRAYAHRQASMYSTLVTLYLDCWQRFLVEHSLGTEWLNLHSASPSSATESAAEEVDGPLEGVSGGEYDDGDEEPDCDDPVDPEFEEKFADLPGN
jgi:PAS domain-containing protein